MHRDRPRALVIACPDGCGEKLTVNLDPALGPPWRLYHTKRGLTLYPSVWRDSGCGSHFIVWNNTVQWCDRWEAGNREPEPEQAFPDLVREVAARLDERLRPYVTVAGELDEVPWEVLRACRALARAGRAVEGTGKQSGWFRRSV
ncbi:DUF6527 family protein [Phenylobacterium soli]|uniref:DUF6527 family protein n=1 Tax=Phenylobacterium soli TaxID=2170551 RepID=UPI00362231C6